MKITWTPIDKHIKKQAIKEDEEEPKEIATKEEPKVTAPTEEKKSENA